MRGPMRGTGVVILLFIIAAVSGAAYLLRVDQVQVKGIRTLDAADVIHASGIEPGQRILWIRLSAATRNVEKLPAVEHAEATRSLPGTVVIRVTEREAVARLDTRSDVAVDATGHLFSDPQPGAIPTLGGWRANKAVRVLDPDTRGALRAFATFPYALKHATRRILVRPAFTLVLDRGLQVRFGELSNARLKALAALTVLRRERGNAISYVDVRLPNMPIVGPVAVPTPAPSPVPGTGPAPTSTPAPTEPPTLTR